MPICPNCSYTLVFLSFRPKYKCALCSRLYPQKEIDAREFRRFNKTQKTLDSENYERERKEELARIRETRKHIKRLFNGFPKIYQGYSKEYYEKNKEKIKPRKKGRRLKNREYDLKRKQEYYQKNKEIINLKAEIRRKNNLQQHNQRKRTWRSKNIERMKISGMIQYYRRKQRELVLNYFKREESFIFSEAD